MRTSRPAGLGPRGSRFWKWANAAFDLERPHLELVAEAARLLDRLDAIAEQVRADGLMTETASGQPRPHPLLAEQRQSALALGRLVDLAGLSEPAVDKPESPTTVRARHAAEVRWARELGVPQLEDRRPPRRSAR